MPAINLSPEDGIDLHLHTTVHDGRWTPDGLVRHAAQRGIRCMAITDHDMVDGIALARTAAAAADIVLVPAVEVTTTWRGREYHVLLYGGRIVPPAPPLAALLAGIMAGHRQRARDWLDQLAHRGITLPSLDEVRRGREVLPIYIAGALIRDGHVPNYAACVALLQSLKTAAPPGAPLRDVVAAAHAAGAVALIAHPGRDEFGFAALTTDDLDQMRREAPLDGVEVYHPNHTPAMRAAYLTYAAQRGLLISAGSDSHGPAHARAPTPHPARLCWTLLERCVPNAVHAGLSADVARAARQGMTAPRVPRGTRVAAMEP